MADVDGQSVSASLGRAAALGVLGLLANMFAVEVHGGATFHFGSLFALFCAITQGPAFGALAACVAVVPLGAAGDWGLASLFVAETWVVGLGVRRQLAPLTADLVFWALGSPLLLAWRVQLDGSLSSQVLVPVLHAPVNGAVCAMLADLFLVLWTTRSGVRRSREGLGQRLPLRRHLVPWLTLVTLIPLLAAGLSAGRDQARERAAEAESSLNSGSEAVARLLSGLINEHLRAVSAAARALTDDATDDSDQIISRLDAVRLTYPSFSTLLVADRDGEIIAGSPAEHGGERWWTGSVSHRDYFQVPRNTGRPYTSDVFLGSGYGANPIIGLSAPVFDGEGQVKAVVEGSMDVRRLQLLATPLAPAEADLVVLDRAQRVLFALGQGHFRPLLDLAGQDLGDRSLVSALAAGERGSLRWQGRGGDQRLLTWRSVESADWRVLAVMSGSRADQVAASVYVKYAGGMLAAVVLTSLLTSLIASRITRPLEGLVAALQSVEADSLHREVPPPAAAAPREVADLVDDFNAMSGRLDQSYAELKRSLADREGLNDKLEGLLDELDVRVRERTRELTESRREAVVLQQQFRALLNDIDAVVCEYDLKSRRFTFVSQRAEDILGLSPQDFYRDRHLWLRALPRGERAKTFTAIQTAIDSVGSYALEHSILTPSGDKRLRNVGRVLEGKEGAAWLRCIMLDVTDSHKAHEDQLRRRQLESVGTLAGGIAHDFNNLLTAILGNLSLARLEVEEGTEAGQVLEIFDEIEAAGTDAQGLSHQLLTFSRGGRPIRRRCHPEDLLHTLLGRRDAHYPVEVDVAQDLPEVMADQKQISQVLAELVRNAEQAMPEGGPITVEVAAETAGAADDLPLEPGEYVRIRVRDQGVGVAEELLAKVFDPYFTTREEGRGFGLATTYSILKNHGGHIHLHSIQGQGTTVTLWLPAVEEEEPIAAPSIPPAFTGRLLLMDDEPSVRLVAGRMLERLGWQVTVTSDGRQAVEAYRRAQESGAGFDAVLTDLTVPGGMGGAETMRQLLQIDPAVRAVVCSGYSNDPVMASYREYGFVGVMTKPFSLEDLRRSLEEVMEMPVAGG